MKIKFKNLFLVFMMLLVLLAPTASFAQVVMGTGAGNSSCASVDAGTIMFIICRIALLINTVIPILISLAVVYFFWGIISYVIADSEEAKKSGRSRIIWGIGALAIIVSLWGVVAILKRTFGIANESSIQVPCIESPGIDCP